MPFETLTSDGLSIVCFLVEHDWETSIDISHYFPTDVTEGLSNREARRPEAEAAMLSCGLTVYMDDEDEAQALRQTFAELDTDWVGVPILADQFLGADKATAGKRIYTPERLVDLTVPAIVAFSASLTADHAYAPLLVGHITELPAIEPHGAFITCSVIVTEDSPWVFRIGGALTISSGTFPATLLPEWTSAPTMTPLKELSFDRIGLQREQTIAGEERAFRWTQEASFEMTTKTEIATLLGFFIASRGAWVPFTAPMWWTPGTPTAEAPHETTCRFAEPSLKLSFDSTHRASARVKVSQVPWEITGTEGETPQQPARIFLYRFRYDLPTPVYYRFTNCWRSLTRTDDGTYAPAPFAHDEIEETADLSGDTVTLQSFLFDGNPLAMFNPRTLEARLWLEIFEIETDPIDADSAVSVWQGSVARCPQKGRSLAAECRWLGGVMDREIPGVRIGPSCSTRIYSIRCGLPKANFEKAGTLASASGNTLTVTITDAAAANTYAPGWVEAGDGSTWELRSIVGSAPVTGGQTLTIDAPIRQAADGQAVKYYRGCDGTAATCAALGNLANFRGHPGLPRVNLSIPAYNAPASGKK